MTPDDGPSKIVCNWIHLTDFAVVDSMGKAILVGVFDRIYATRVPVAHPICFLALELDGPPGLKTQLRLQIQRPGGLGGIMDLPVVCEFGTEGRANFMIRLDQLQLPDYGSYRILVSGGPDVIKTSGLSVLAPPKAGH